MNSQIDYGHTVELALNFIEDNYQQPLTIAQLSRHCYVSPFHFSRIFKQVISCSPYQYIQMRRLDEAVTLLNTTSLSITEISYLCGFSSLERFVTAFKKRYNTQPSKCRNSA